VEKLYREYFQKSKVFLYPLLGIKKGVRFVPTQTYLSWNDKYDIDSDKLLCLYVTDEDNKDQFTIFSDRKLKLLPVFEEKHDIDEFNFLYVFDLTLPLKRKDIKRFKEGKYSKLTKKTKEIIIKFFGERGKIAEYIESYLYPGYYWEDYSELLNVKIKDLQEVGELCNKPDLQKEDFTLDCELIKKLVYLKIKN